MLQAPRTSGNRSRPSKVRHRSRASIIAVLVILTGLTMATPVAGAEEEAGVQLNDGPASGGLEPNAVTGTGGMGLAALPEGGCDGGEIYDDGIAENGYSGNPATVDSVDNVMLFTPQSYPAGYETVCLALVSLGGPTLDFKLTFWDNDGAAETPGTLLAETDILSVDDLPAGLPCRMYEVDISELGLVIPEGSVYIGARWSPMAFPSRFLCSDETPATPLRAGFINFNLGDGWQQTQTVFPGYRAMRLRAVQDLTPPETLIVSGPGEGSTITDVMATFEFESDDPDATFECSVDGSPFAACSGPGDTHTTGFLENGAHVFAVRASDQFGNTDPTPASRNFDRQAADLVGLVDPVTGIWNLRGATGAVSSFFYGNPGDYPFVGDWNCDGVDTPGLYRQSDGFVYLRNSNSEGVADIRFFFGNPGDIPLAGDFDNDGCDTVSIYRPAEARIFVINELGANDGGLGAADFDYVFGNPGDKPFVGDFNGDGIDTVGLHRESTGFVYFRQSHSQGNADSEFFFGDPGDRLVAGDWGVIDDVDTPAIFRPSNATFYFRFTNTQGNADDTLVWGASSQLPVAGWWGP